MLVIAIGVVKHIVMSERPGRQFIGIRITVVCAWTFLAQDYPVDVHPFDTIL
jgi:hypothetical protein